MEPVVTRSAQIPRLLSPRNARTQNAVSIQNVEYQSGGDADLALLELRLNFANARLK